jgi:FGGY family of carbohydrate kinases, C-terminal domain
MFLLLFLLRDPQPRSSSRRAAVRSRSARYEPLPLAMRAQGMGGDIIYICSKNSVVAGPANVAYGAAKADQADPGGRGSRAVHVVGGGVANPLFCQLAADACQLPVVAGPTEAACWGNTLVQARALGAAGQTLADLRSLVPQEVSLTGYRPAGPDWAWERAQEIVLASRS